jgi:hypothetical protein
LRVRVGPIRAVERSGFTVVLLLEAELLDSVAAFQASPEVSAVAFVPLSEVGRLAPLNARLLRRAFAASAVPTER